MREKKYDVATLPTLYIVLVCTVKRKASQCTSPCIILVLKFNKPQYLGQVCTHKNRSSD